MVNLQQLFGYEGCDLLATHGSV